MNAYQPNLSFWVSLITPLNCELQLKSLPSPKAHRERQLLLPDALARFQKVQLITKRMRHRIGAASCATSMQVQLASQPAAQAEELVGSDRCWHQAPRHSQPQRQRTESFNHNFLTIPLQIAHH